MKDMQVFHCRIAILQNSFFSLFPDFFFLFFFPNVLHIIMFLFLPEYLLGTPHFLVLII